MSPTQTTTSGREALLDAAERLLLTAHSPDEISVRAIASEAGVTAPALYHHFEDKDALFFGVCERRFGEFNERLMSAVASATSPMERIEALGRAYVTYGLERPEHYRLLFVHAAPESIAAIEDPAELPGMKGLELLITAVLDGIEDGSLRRGDPLATAYALWAATHGAVMLALDAPSRPKAMPAPDNDTLIDAVMEIATRGLTR